MIGQLEICMFPVWNLVSSWEQCCLLRLFGSKKQKLTQLNYLNFSGGDRTFNLGKLTSGEIGIACETAGYLCNKAQRVR